MQLDVRAEAAPSAPPGRSVNGASAFRWRDGCVRLSMRASGLCADDIDGIVTAC